MNKSYFIKVFEAGQNGKFIKTLSDISFNGFRKQINGGLGELSFDYARKFDDFDENYIIKFNNKIELWVADGDTGTDGRLIYSGYISRYEPFIDENKEGVTVRCLGYVTKLAKTIVKNGTQIELKTDSALGLTTGVTASATEVAKVVRAIIDRYRAESYRPIINYTPSSVSNTAQNMTYTLNGMFIDKAIDKCREFAPSDWWWFIGADNILVFEKKPPKPKHSFIFGKHFKSIKVSKNMEGVVNKVLFSSGDNADRQILKLYSDNTSLDEFDDCWEIVTDNRVSVAETANNVGQSTLAEKKDSEIRTIIEILDNNGSPDSGYDIEDINPGDTCQFLGLSDITSQTFNDNMVIVSVDYGIDKVTLELEKLSSSIVRENKENSDKIDEQESSGRAKSYDTDSNGWHEVGASGEPAFQNSWVNYGGAWDTVAFMKDSLGFVHIKGLAKNGTIGQVIFTLPVGYRPALNQLFAIDTEVNAHGRIQVESTGIVVAQTGNNTYYGTNITFKAEQ